MGWLPESHSDSFWFLVSPVTTVPMLSYAVGGYVTDEYPYGKPDWRASVRNTVLWGGLASANWAYHAIAHPGKYAFTSGSTAYKVVGYLAWPGLLSAAMIAAAATAGVGYVATADVHGGAFSVPGGSMSLGPGAFGKSDPSGDFEKGVTDFFEMFGF